MSEPNGWGRGQSAAPPSGFSGHRPVAPLEWVAFVAGVAAFLCLFFPWFGADLTLDGGGDVSLTFRGLDLGLAVAGASFLLLGGLLPVLRQVERALSRTSDAPASTPGPSLLAPLLSAMGAILVFLQLVHEDESLAGNDVVYRKYGVILAFVVALVAGASAVLGHLQARGLRLLPAPAPGAPSGQP